MSKANKHGETLARLADRKTVSMPAQPAATVVLVRDGAPGLEVLMLRRNSRIAFGGMWVFPGGRVDPEDRVDPQGRGDEDEVAHARRAAVREAEEEAGLRLHPPDLVTYSHWTPPPISPRRFVTWFFIARAPESDVAVDMGEIHEHAWMRPGEALERRDAGEIELAAPTFVTLHELRGHDAVESALAHSRAREPERFATVIGRVEGGAVALWHGDAGYADAKPDLPGARHRLWMVDGGWRYERNP